MLFSTRAPIPQQRIQQPIGANPDRLATIAAFGLPSGAGVIVYRVEWPDYVLATVVNPVTMMLALLNFTMREPL